MLGTKKVSYSHKTRCKRALTDKKRKLLRRMQKASRKINFKFNKRR